MNDSSGGNTAGNPALTSVLRASLALEEGRDGPNPLREADPASLDELFDRINLKLVAGMPESITEDDLLPVVNVLRAQRLKFIQDQERKTAAGPRRSGANTATKTPSARAQQILSAGDLDI